jgi:Mor family transcriptional regulator
MTRSERNKAIIAGYKAGKPMKSLAAKWGLTYRQIYRILAYAYCDRRGWQDKRRAA